MLMIGFSLSIKLNMQLPFLQSKSLLKYIWEIFWEPEIATHHSTIGEKKLHTNISHAYICKKQKQNQKNPSAHAFFSINI